MKKFSELRINDNFFKVDFSINPLPVKDNYGNTYSSDFIKVYTVKNIHEIKGDLVINKPDGRDYSDLILVGSYPFSVAVRDEKNKHILWCADETALTQIVKKELLRIMKEKEDSIPEYVKRIETEISDIRRKYWDFLN
jgi:hypothetical protein